ncbi:amidohydrolase family protein [Brevibacterium album]|uniref:amidohydrolase family protein n=1 Tax=Brevibacterium album TaxID=417948 RepID=UPI00040D0801|nr:amidohydrolase family protein [Brevibacterium album]
MSGLAVRNATIIDATGAPPLQGGTVVMGEDGRIEALGPDQEVAIPPGAETLDGTGRWVVPGLMDANVHLVAARTPDTLLEFQGRYEELAFEAAELTLKYGVTTVFDTWGPAGPATRVRDAIASGTAAGSRIYCSGNIIGLGGPLSDDFVAPGDFLHRDTVAAINREWERGMGPHLATMSVAQIAEATAQYIEETGVDFIKWAATDHLATAGGMIFLMFSEQAQEAIHATAHSYGKPTQAHTTTVDSLRISADIGVDLLQHGDLTVGRPAPEELLDQIAQKGIPTAALVCTDEHLAWSGSAPAAARMHPVRVNADRNQRGLIARGARLLLTTDGFAYGPRITEHPGFRAGTLSPEVPDLPVQLGYSHLNWIRGAAQRGLGMMEILRSATAYIAEAYGVADRLGTLEPGKIGDLLILGSDPLESPQAYADIREVVKEGIRVDRDALARNLQVGLDVLAARV